MSPVCGRCGKRLHRDFGAAVRAALHDSRAYGTALRPYACPDGGGWHLTRRYLSTSPYMARRAAA